MARSHGLKAKTLRRMLKKRLHMRGGGVMQKMGDDGKPVDPPKWTSDKTGMDYDTEAEAKKAEEGVEGPDKPAAASNAPMAGRRRRRSRRREEGGRRRGRKSRRVEEKLGY